MYNQSSRFILLRSCIHDFWLGQERIICLRRHAAAAAAASCYCLNQWNRTPFKSIKSDTLKMAIIKYKNPTQYANSAIPHSTHVLKRTRPRKRMDPFIGTAGVKRDKTAIHGGLNSFWCTAYFYLIIFGGWYLHVSPSHTVPRISIIVPR
jgi:hypothetical protein